MEVRFDDRSAVAEAVTEAVRTALLDHGLVRSGAPRGRSAPEEATVDPETPDREVSNGPPTGGGSARGSSDRDSGDGSTAAGSDDAEPRPDADASGRRRPRPAAGDSTREGSGSPDDGREAATPDDAERGGDGWSTADDRERSTLDAERSTADEKRAGGDGGDAGPSGVGPADAGRAGSVLPPSDQRTLDGESAAPDREFDRLPPMRVLGQFDDTYVVAETPDGLALIDQHAADERINYERLQAEVGGETPTQALAEPVDLELTAREAALFDTYRDALAELGFHAERTGERTVEVRTVPTVFDTALDPSILRDALTGFADGDDGGATVDAVADDLLADLACYPSITGNTSLTEGSIVDLLDALDDCENPFACPHGRPVVVALDRDEIADRFERDYPGHGGRRRE